jgi:serine/threonine protein kinase
MPAATQDEDGRVTTDTSLLFGRYRLLEQIARGGMAEVFKAKSHGVEGFEKVLVLKRILPELANNPQFVEMFLQEARLSVTLSHANIVQVFDLGREDDTYFIAMEYVPGMDLARVIRHHRKRSKPTPIALCVYIACEVARGLDYAHRRKDAHGQALGVVHRDVSPQNVLLSFEGEVKIADFGIARARNTVEQNGAVRGKYAYMAPEQANGQPIDARADVYALGVTLYEALTGRNPFVARTPQEVLLRVKSGAWTPLREARPDVPADLAEVIERSLSLRADARPPSAAVLYEELTQTLYSSGHRVGPHDLAEWVRAVRNEQTSGSDDELDPASQPGSAPAHAEKVYRPFDEWRDATFVALQIVDAPREGDVFEPLLMVALRHGATPVERSPTSLVLAFGIENPDGRDTLTATRMALRLHAAATRAARTLHVRAGVGGGVYPARIVVRGDNTPEPGERLDAVLTGVKALAAAAKDRVLAGSSVASAVADTFECVRVVEGGVVIQGELAPARRRVVGRRDAFRTFGEVLAQAANEGAQVLSLEGEGGIGKTRFLEEVIYRLRKQQHPVIWYGATCLPQDRDAPASGLRVMLRMMLGIEETDPEALMRDKARQLRDFGLNSDEMMIAGVVLGVVTTGPEAFQASTKALRSALVKIVTSLTGERITVLAWDQAEWMDDLSRSHVDELIRAGDDLPVLVVIASRPGRPFPWDGLVRRHLVSLGGLTPEEVLQLMALRLGATSISEALFNELYARAGGNLLHLEEHLKAMVESGLVSVRNGEAHMRATPTTSVIPRALRGLVSSRAMVLTPTERHVLQAATALGDEFRDEELVRVGAIDRATLTASLHALVAHGFVEQVGVGRYRFLDTTVREVLYERIVENVRRELKARIGAAPA